MNNDSAGCVFFVLVAGVVGIIYFAIWRQTKVDDAKAEQRCNDRGGVMTDMGCFQAGARIKL